MSSTTKPPRQALGYILLSFASGSIPFSLLVGYALLQTDIRSQGDGNPGATNVYRAGGKMTAFIALLLDMLKGAIPVAFAYHRSHIGVPDIIPIAVAPVAGHAFSPFLRGRGGKAVAVTGGVWGGLTGWEGPTIGGLLLTAGTYLLGANGRAVLMAFTGMIIYLLATPERWNMLGIRPPRKLIFFVGVSNFAILAWKHRQDLASPISTTRS